jgi:hypothetical protein
MNEPTDASRQSWIRGGEACGDVVSLQPHLNPFITHLKGQASALSPGRTAELISTRIAQLLDVAGGETSLGEAVRNWYSSDELTAAEKVVLDIAEQFVIDVHGVTDEGFARLRDHYDTPDILAMLFQMALCDGFTKFTKVASADNAKEATNV